jgi:uncharacterized membrane protein
MSYQFFATFHLVAACTALIAGLCVLFPRKGTRLHKQLGYVYFFNMLALNISAFCIYRLTGHFGPFHGAALASLLTLLAGFVPAYLHLPQERWLALHYEFMNWSYVGLVAAGISEAATRIPTTPFWPAIAAASLVIFITGGALIIRGRARYRFENMTRLSHHAQGIGDQRRAACN